MNIPFPSCGSAFPSHLCAFLVRDRPSAAVRLADPTSIALPDGFWIGTRPIDRSHPASRLFSSDLVRRKGSWILCRRLICDCSVIVVAIADSCNCVGLGDWWIVTVARKDWRSPRAVRFADYCNRIGAARLQGRSRLARVLASKP